MFQLPEQVSGAIPAAIVDQHDLVGGRHAVERHGAVATAAAAVVVTLASVQRERLTRARKLGVSVLALSNPDRLMKRLRRSGGL